jgi:hypothetical protein
MLGLLDRALTDAAFLEALAADPLGTAQAAGVAVSARELKLMLGMPEATDQELVEMLRTRIIRSHSLGCSSHECDCQNPD